jgi:succinate dehydrogenase / fumarate reductase membrane anchor subunit
MRDRGVGSGGALSWFFQRLTGILLVPIVILHLLTMHKWTAHSLPWAEVAVRMSNPYWKVLELTFLVVALYHGLNGLYAVLQDYVRKPAWRLTCYSLVTLAGLILLAFGVVTVVGFPRAELVSSVAQALTP